MPCSWGFIVIEAQHSPEVESTAVLEQKEYTLRRLSGESEILKVVECPNESTVLWIQEPASLLACPQSAASWRWSVYQSCDLRQRCWKKGAIKKQQNLL